MPRLLQSQRELLELAVTNYETHLTEVMPYLKSRGITEETARTFRLGYVKHPELGHEQFANRIAIPYITPTGIVDIRFRSADATDTGPKYLSRPGAPTHIYNVKALGEDTDTLVVCEGEFDTIIATQARLNAVGLPGANNWKSFFVRLMSDFTRVVVLIDGDNAGREMGKHLAREVDNCVVVPMPDGMDVNDVYLQEGAEGLHKRVGT